MPMRVSFVFLSHIKKERNRAGPYSEYIEKKEEKKRSAPPQCLLVTPRTKKAIRSFPFDRTLMLKGICKTGQHDTTPIGDGGGIHKYSRTLQLLFRFLNHILHSIFGEPFFLWRLEPGFCLIPNNGCWQVRFHRLSFNIFCPSLTNF